VRVEPTARRVVVEHGGNIVFGVAGGKQHARHGENVIGAAGAQIVKPLADGGPGEFEKPVHHLAIRQMARDMPGQRLELGDRLHVAAAVTA
jgi:hypothetical protein